MKTKPEILVVDDDPLVRQSCQRVLAQHYHVVLTESGQEGLARLTAETFDLALVDLKLPDVSGMDILSQAPDDFPQTPIVMITGYSTIQTAVEAIKKGAFDYLAKPFSPVELEVVVEKAVRERRLRMDNRALQADRYRVSRLIGQSPAIKRVFERIDQVAQTDSTVLLTGESGTGKELVAQAIHFSSSRKNGHFVTVDCGAIAQSLIASELFGHVRGAFSGAVSDRDGLIQAADGGTLLLDEIGNLPLQLQATLLRVIESSQVRAVGSDETAKVNVRYIAATNRDLRALVEAGGFREDLFYRFDVFPIELPPLRERREDIGLLVEHFLSVFCARMHKRIEGFTPEAMRLLMEYPWPGNVRELSNVVERLVILCDAERIGRRCLMDSMSVPTPAPAVAQTVEKLNELKKRLRDEAVEGAEKHFLLAALRRNDYNVTRAAAQTGMQRSNLQALLKKHGLRIRDIANTIDGNPITGTSDKGRNGAE